VSYEFKTGHQDIVTESDKGSEKIILGRIRNQYPTHGILSEESPPHESSSGYRWVIDPIDGTTNFAHGIPLFTISMALEFEGSPVVGIVYDPMRDEMFASAKGFGSKLNDRVLSVTSSSSLENSVLSAGYPYDEDKLDEFLEALKLVFPKSRGLRRLGSTALCLAYVSAGRLDGYWGQGVYRWDISAGILLVEEAGGKISDLSGGQAADYKTTILSSNGKIHDELLNLVGV
jgi:myo-inositol-1(or 4)-monophosphatase